MICGLLEFVECGYGLFDFFFASSEEVDSLCSLYDDFFDDDIVGAGAFDFGYAEVCHLSDVGEEVDEAHEDAHFVVDLLVDVEFYLNDETITSS